MGKKTNNLLGFGAAYIDEIEQEAKKTSNVKIEETKKTETINNREEKKTVKQPKQKEEKPVIVKQNEIELIETPTKVVRGTKLFSLSTPGIIRPKRAKKGEGGKFKYLSVYLPVEEIKMVEELADKYGMTTSNYVRTLIINSD